MIPGQNTQEAAGIDPREAGHFSPDLARTIYTGVFFLFLFLTRER